MGPETKAKALEKVRLFTPKIGYPDKWRDYSRAADQCAATWSAMSSAPTCSNITARSRASISRSDRQRMRA